MDGWISDDAVAQVGETPANGQSRYKFPMEIAESIELDRNPWYLIKGLMPRSGLHILYGAPGTGKSFVALDAALHVATGRSWGGRRVRQADVVYVASEGGTGFRLRVIAALAALREKGCSEQARFGLVTVAPNLGRERSDLDRLVREVSEQSCHFGLQPGLIVLDTLARSCRGLDESSTRDMNDFIGNAMELSRRFGHALVMPIHHCGKDEERGMRGSSALLGAADAVWRLRNENGANEVQVEKMKDAESGSALAFELRPHDLGLDSDGDPLRTLVVDVGEKPETLAKASGAKPPRRYATLARIAAALVEHGSPETSGPAKAMSLSELKALLTAGIEGPDFAKIEASAINRDIQQLVNEELLGRSDNRVWCAVVA